MSFHVFIFALQQTFYLFLYLQIQVIHVVLFMLYRLKTEMPQKVKVKKTMAFHLFKFFFHLENY